MQCCKSIIIIIIIIIIIQNAFKCNLKQLTEQQRAPSVLVLYDWSICLWLIFFNIIHVIPWHEELPLCSILCHKVSFSQFPPPPPFFFIDIFLTVTGACFSFCRCSWLGYVVVLAMGALFSLGAGYQKWSYCRHPTFIQRCSC